MILYHSSRNKGILEKSPFIGADREELSVLLGGLVGFAYGYLPNEWRGKDGIYEIIIPDDRLVIVAINGYDVPRTNYTTGERNWDNMCEIIPSPVACQYEGEVAFLASDAIFGRKI